MKLWLGVILVLVFAAPVRAENFQSWLHAYQQRAIAAGVNAQIVHRALDNITWQPDIIRLDQKQPEGHLTLLDYVDRMVNAKRIANGRQKFKQHRAILAQVEQRSGVPAEILVALWGKESDFGANYGRTPIIPALATLAYEGRRRAFFEQELLNAIVLTDRLQMQPEQMIGSWAGAVGQCQLMPSNYIKFALDGNDNGRVDLWGEMPDVFASMANLLRHEGWQSGASWAKRLICPLDLTILC